VTPVRISAIPGALLELAECRTEDGPAGFLFWCLLGAACHRLQRLGTKSRVIARVSPTPSRPPYGPREAANYDSHNDNTEGCNLKHFAGCLGYCHPDSASYAEGPA
jgi:hypothetical protein